ncbi:MAG: UDP-N-acetylmuramate dehydrogenase [Alphaproteobacteria bacterium]|nr:UDP-N-acetylmuramate dehydrogenase [Alphaproteobacteria bacterium]
MMPARKSTPSLIERLPAVRGRYSESTVLANTTWFRVGGAAEVMFRPADLDDLADFLAAHPADVPITVVGVGSNLLVRDGGVPGVVIRLGRGFADIRVEGDVVIAGAGALDLNVAHVAAEAGLAGLEFLCGVPGTIGGALRMNAGAYGAEVKDVLVSAKALDPRGRRYCLTPEHIGLAYRRCSLPEGWIFTSARFRARPGDKAQIIRRMADIQAERADTQPVRTRTGGSTFANPPSGAGGGRKAWELIDRAGCRGLKRGGAMVSEKHCNFLINTGDATAADIEGLGEEVRRRVFEATGVTLEWEIRRIGVPSGPLARDATA